MKIVLSLLIGFVAGLVVAGQAPVIHAYLGTKAPETYSPRERVVISDIQFEDDKSFCADLQNVSSGTVDLVRFELKVTLPRRSTPLKAWTGNYQSDFIMEPGQRGTICWSKDDEDVPFRVEVDNEWREIKQLLEAEKIDVRATAIDAQYQN